MTLQQRPRHGLDLRIQKGVNAISVNKVYIKESKRLVAFIHVGRSAFTIQLVSSTTRT